MKEDNSTVKNKTCPNCDENFICISDDIERCECYPIPLHKDDLHKIKNNFLGCLCKRCLIQFSSIEIDFQ